MKPAELPTAPSCQADGNRGSVPAHQRPARRACLPAGGARDRGDAAIADRPLDRDHDRRAVLRGAGLVMVGHGRHRGFGHRENRAERANQGDPAVRDRRGARHPGAGRAGGQGRRRAGRARSDRECRGTRPSAERPIGEQLNAARLRAALAATGDLEADFVAARRCGPGSRQHPSPAIAQPGQRTPRQDRLAGAAAGAEGSRAGHDRGHHPQAGSDDSRRPATRRHPQDADGKGTYARRSSISRSSSCWSSSRRNSASRRAI